MFTFKLLTIFSLFILTLCKAVVDDSTFLHAALDSSPSSELDGNLITEFSTTLGLLGNNDPLGEALDLQLGQILADVDQDSHCSADSPEQVHPQPAYEEGSRRKREESSSCSKRQFYEQRGTTSLQKPTDGGQPRGQAGAESTQPGSNQNTDEKNIHDFEAPTDSQFGIPNTRICGDSDMNIPMCHPHDATDPVGIYLFPCRACKLQSLFSLAKIDHPLQRRSFTFT